MLAIKIYIGTLLWRWNPVHSHHAGYLLTNKNWNWTFKSKCQKKNQGCFWKEKFSYLVNHSGLNLSLGWVKELVGESSSFKRFSLSANICYKVATWKKYEERAKIICKPPNWKQPKRPQISKCLVHHSAINRNQLSTHPATWMDLKGITLMKIKRQSQQIRHCTISFVWCSQSDKITELGNRLVVVVG